MQAKNIEDRIKTRHYFDKLIIFCFNYVINNDSTLFNSIDPSLSFLSSWDKYWGYWFILYKVINVVSDIDGGSSISNLFRL